MWTTKVRFLGIILPLISVSTVYSAPGNVLLDRGRTEPVVMTDPHHPTTVIVGANPNYAAPVNGTYPMPFFTSHDGGHTFQHGAVPLPRAYVSATDPSLAISRSGTIFYGFAAVHPGSSVCANCKCSETEKPHGAILLSRSMDGGRSFREPVVVDTSINADRPGFAVENVPRHRAHVFMTWTRSQTDLWFARSTDGGVTFSSPVQLYRSNYVDAPSLPVVQSPGHVAVFWIETGGDNSDGTTPARILVQSSTDDGKHFGPVETVASWFKTMPRQVQPGNLRTPPSFTVVAGPGGTLYVAWPAVRQAHADGSVDADIDLTWSKDGGTSWHAPITVNDVRSRDRFMPAMTVLPDGSLGVSFYDRRAGLNNLAVYAVHVTIQGGYRRSINVPVSRHYANIAFIHQIPVSTACGSVSPGRFFGDYMGTSADGSRSLRVTWADSGLGIREETDVWLARVQLPALAAGSGH
jgi:hypothetical protein